MKRKVWIFTSLLVAAFGAAVLAASFFFDGNEVHFKERIGAESEKCIEGFAAPSSFGHFVTDLIEYRIIVTYCEGIEVDTEQLLKEIDFFPFDIVRNIKIAQRVFSNGVNELALSYTLQAIDVYPGEEYVFPDILVEYSQEGSVEGDVYWIQDIEPIYISKLTLASDQEIEFRPVKSEIAPKKAILSQRILLIAGSIVLVLGLIEALYLLRPKRSARKSVKMSYREEVFSTLEIIDSEAKHNARAALHKLYNLVLEISEDAPMWRYQEILERLSEEISILAYGRGEPTREVAVEKTEKFRTILSKKRGGDY